MNDIELTQAALEACGYRVHLRERAGTRWVTAAKGLQVQYVHWHPLTNINQAMQLLIEAPKELDMSTCSNGSVFILHEGSVETSEHAFQPDPKALIVAQCRAIVTACASLKGVR